MKLTSAQQRHCDNAPGFAKALAAASFVIRCDSRLTGLDKIRTPLAYHAALAATNFRDKADVPITGFAVPADAGPSNTGVQQVVDELFITARDKAEEALR